MTTDPATASLSLTHISYDPEDLVSYVCAWLSLTPQALMVAFVTLSWSSREAEVLLAFAGQLACEALNFGLKRLIREERPVLIHRGKGYGMPSSHAQFMAFFATYMALFLLVRHRPEVKESLNRPASKIRTEKNKTKAGRSQQANSLAWLLPPQWMQQILTAVGVVVIAAGVAVSRVYLGYHSRKQVFVGCGVGTGFGIVWFAATEVLRTSGWLQWALDLDAARLLRMRDLLTTQDLPESGWRTYEDGLNSALNSKSGSKLEIEPESVSRAVDASNEKMTTRARTKKVR